MTSTWVVATSATSLEWSVADQSLVDRSFAEQVFHELMFGVEAEEPDAHSLDAQSPVSQAPDAQSPDGVLSLQALSVLGQQVPAEVSESALLDGLGTWQRFLGFATSRMCAQLAELHARRTGPARARMDAGLAVGDLDTAEAAADELDIAERGLVAEVATDLSWSCYRAARQVEVAVTLVGDLTATFDAVASGRLEPIKAETIARALRELPENVRRTVEDDVLPHAAGWNLPELAENLKTAILRADPEAANERARRARARRHVRIVPEADDMMRLEALMPVQDGVRVGNALALAQKAAKTPGDERTADQRMLDALVDTLTTQPTKEPADEPTEAKAGSKAGSKGRARRGLAAEINVTVPLETLTGDAEHPGYLSRYGPITAETARRMAWDVAAEGYWRCLITDNVHGTLLGMGRSTFTPAYHPPEYLQRYTNLRDRTCYFPGCRRPAETGDFDHVIPHAQGGATCECSGRKACGNHHRIKHETSWTVAHCDDPTKPPGTVIWTSPTGRRHLQSPPAIGIPTTPRTNTNAPTASTYARAHWDYQPGLPELPIPDGPPPPY